MSAHLISPAPLASQSFGEASNLPSTTIDAKLAAIISIEGMALQNNMLPVNLLRESCSPEAERIVRKLGRVPYVADPWLPVTMVGPLLVMAHHNPRAGDTWGVPSFLAIRILITPDQYQKTRKDLVQRFGQLPIAQQNALENAQPPNFSELGLEGSFEWLMEHYPFEPAEVTKMQGFYESQKEKHPKLEPSHFNSVMRNLGPALQHLVSGGRALCFSASEAQRQTFFPLPLLERHTVYPLYIGKNAVFLLSEHTDCYSFEDEWLSMGNSAVKIIPCATSRTSTKS